MAHFGVQKAKSKALVALATAAAISGAAFNSAPANAANMMQIGTFSIEADGKLPAVEGGWSQNYDYWTYEVSEEETGLHKIQTNNYFGCDARTGTSGSGVLLKNKEAFQNFVTNYQGAADKMIQACEQVTDSHKSGKLGVYEIEFNSEEGRAYQNSIYTTYSGEIFTVKTDLDFDPEAHLEEKSESSHLLVRNTFNQNGKMSFQVTPKKVGHTKLRYVKGDQTLGDFSIYVSDIEDIDSEGNIYYNNPDRYGDDYFAVYAHYIGTEALDLDGIETNLPSGRIYLEIGTRGNEAMSETGTDSPVTVGTKNNPLTLNLGSLNSELRINGGSHVKFTGNINNDITISKNTLVEGDPLVGSLTVESDSTQNSGEKRRIDNEGDLTIKGGTYNNIQIAGGNIDIQGGSFRQEGEAATMSNDSIVRGSSDGSITISGADTKFEHVVTSPEGDNAIWHNDTYALIHTYGSDVTIDGGTFISNGSIISGEDYASATAPRGNYTINGGTFEAKHIAAFSNNWQGKMTINGGDFKTTDRFYVWDTLEDWEDNKLLNQYDSLPEGLGSVGEVVRYKDSEGNEHRNWGTGSMGVTRTLIKPTLTNMEVNGGDFSDGYDEDSDTGVFPAADHDEVELDGDYDNDGRKDVRVLPAETYEIVVEVGEKTYPRDLPEGYEIVSIDGDDVCTAEIIDGAIVISGLSAGECTVKASDKENDIQVFNVHVTDLEDYAEGDPLSIPVGETKTPEDLDGKNPADLDWTVVEGRDYCTVSDSGAITAIKGGGTCKVTARDPETGDTTVWEVQTTEPLEIGVGESKKPTDLPDGAENGEWSSSDTNICTVASDGTITGKKAGTCYVTLTLDGKVYTWKVTITGNPDTADKTRAAIFTVAGAVTAGFAALSVAARRFFGRK